MIKRIFEEGRNIYGTHRIAEILAKQDVVVSRRVGKLLAEASLSCKTKLKFKATTDSKHNKYISPNLLERQFIVARSVHRFA